MHTQATCICVSILHYVCWSIAAISCGWLREAKTMMVRKYSPNALLANYVLIFWLRRGLWRAIFYLQLPNYTLGSSYTCTHIMNDLISVHVLLSKPYLLYININNSHSLTCSLWWCPSRWLTDTVRSIDAVCFEGPRMSAMFLQPCGARPSCSVLAVVVTSN